MFWDNFFENFVTNQIGIKHMNTMGIWIQDYFGIQMAESSQIVEWSAIQMVIWIVNYFGLLFKWWSE